MVDIITCAIIFFAVYSSVNTLTTGGPIKPNYFPHMRYPMDNSWQSGRSNIRRPHPMDSNMIPPYHGNQM